MVVMVRPYGFSNLSGIRNCMDNLTANNMVKSFQINQATTHVFQDLYMHNTMVILVQSGSKVVRNDKQNAIDVHPGELLIFPSGTYITIENRIISGEDYNAWCVSYPDQYIQSMFPELYQSTNTEPVIGAITGGYCGSSLSLAKGERFIRHVFAISCALIGSSLIYSSIIAI